MTEVLRPSLHLFRSAATTLAELRKGFSKGMRVEVGKASLRKRLAEDLSDRTGVCPMSARQARYFELPALAIHDSSCWKQWIVIREELIQAQKLDPIIHN